LLQDGFQVIDDLLGEDVGTEEIIGFFKAFVSEPEDIADDEFLVVVGALPTIGDVQKVET